MDDRRFDTLTRGLATPASRRGVLRRLRLAGGAAMLATLTGRSRSALANHCTYEGCGCATGTRHACGGGLVCCASSPGTPGGAGVCTPHGQCGPVCVDRGNACPGYCNRDDGCPDCCSGYCGTRGACDTPPNVSQPCAGSCQYGLRCCPYVPGLAGGAGICEYRC